MIAINWTRPMTWNLTMSLSLNATPTAEQTDRGRVRRHRIELDDYLRQLEDIGDPDVYERASAAIWDVILEAEMTRKQQPA